MSGDEEVWEHEVPSDDDVFAPPLKKRKSRPLIPAGPDEVKDLSAACAIIPAVQSPRPPSVPPPTSTPVSPKTPPPASPTARSYRQERISLTSGPNETEQIFKGPKKTSQVLCWLEGEYLRRNIPRAYR